MSGKRRGKGATAPHEEGRVQSDVAFLQYAITLCVFVSIYLFAHVYVQNLFVLAAIKIIPMVLMIFWLQYVLYMRGADRENAQLLPNASKLSLSCFSEYVTYLKWGFSFSMCGDILLELEDAFGFSLFVPGLLSFLVAHIVYIYAFKMVTEEYTCKSVFGWNLTYPLAAAVVIAVGLLRLLIPGAEPALRAPVVVYCIVICSMAVLAINRYLQVKDAASLYCMIGALVFVLSDSFIGISKFYHNFQHSKIAVMVTYYLAQALITMSTPPACIAINRKAV